MSVTPAALMSSGHAAMMIHRSGVSYPMTGKRKNVPIAAQTAAAA